MSEEITVTLDSATPITVVFSNGGPIGVSGSSGSSGLDGTYFGSSGTSGTSGTGVTSGISGSSGSSGSSGTSGSTGSHGTSGTSGTHGTSGTSGTSGSTGSAGTSGSTGTAGTSGTSGSSGSSSTSGTSGTDGTHGTSGTSGSNGTHGTSGTSGSSGTSGTSGSSGTSNTSGSAQTASVAGTAYYATTAGNAGTSSYATSAGTAGGVTGLAITAGKTITATENTTLDEAVAMSAKAAIASLKPSIYAFDGWNPSGTGANTVTSPATGSVISNNTARCTMGTISSGTETFTFVTAGFYRVTLTAKSNHTGAYALSEFNFTYGGTAAVYSSYSSGSLVMHDDAAETATGSAMSITLDVYATAGQTLTVLPACKTTVTTANQHAFYAHVHVLPLG